MAASLPFVDKPKASKKQLRTKRFFEDEVRRQRRFTDVPRAVVPSTAHGGAIESTIPDSIGHIRERDELLRRLRHLHANYLDKEHNKMIVRTSNYKERCAEETQNVLARRKQSRKQFFCRSRRGRSRGLRATATGANS